MPGRSHWKVFIAFALSGAVVMFAVVALAQPIIAQIKAFYHAPYIDFIYDANPSTSGNTNMLRMDGENTRTIMAGDVRVCDTYDGCPTVSVSTANGELYVEGDIEADANLNVAGTSTVTGTSTFTGDVTLSGGAGALNFGNDGSIVVEDNNAAAFLVGSTGQLNLLTLDTADDTETVVVTGTTATDAFSVATGEATFAERVDFADLVALSDGATIDQSANNVVTIAENSEDIEFTFAADLCTIASTTGATLAITPATAIAGVLSGSGTAAWGSIVAGADTACNTTCTAPCLFGVNTASLTADIVDCTDATADECLCFGAN